MSTSSEPRDIVRAWLEMVLKRTGWNVAQLARECHVAPSTLGRALDGANVPSMATLSKIVAATGIVLPAGLGFEVVGSHHFSEPEAIPCEISMDDPADPSDHSKTWTIKSRALELAGVLPGDIVAVERSAPAQSGDIVQARVYDIQSGSAETLFRLYDPPYLVARSVDPAVPTKPLLVDGDRVVIVGVVTRLLRRRPQPE